MVGGGPAGAIAARMLALKGARVLLSDARTSPAAEFRAGESLLPSARMILAGAGVWESFVAQQHLPCYGNLSAWGGSALADMDSLRSPYGHGWHLDRARFDAMLLDAAADAGATVRRERFIHGRERARWLVDCGGRTAPVARAFGVVRRFEDRLVAFFARFESRDEDSRTLVESAPDGWFHTALLPTGERIVTFFTDGRDRLAELLPSTVHVRHRVGRMLEPARAADARSSRLERFHGDGWIAAGDAATSFDPLSSQGILSALYGGLKAAEAIIGEDLDAYDAAIARVYEQFLSNRAQVYAAEQRWSGRPFWSARRDSAAFYTA